ncbi:carboxypeptidase-like regulatory domain-containing protein [Actinoplanes sp. KI2]|uniref:carboxypeptidase-like regulatory domain-containing protein n=1 Tax=Actinoplanes sp. KI2 TaxID=2983315 RepID=UPI0021D5F560|nr:carboxypeptidase-like regulatory domain-containing protein [Actinoplanes sp. KI2]MCU7730350.1 carboxypeptidase-like regulatory domain-containing protein [Actinoplanes sp. KI2]
MSTPALAAGVGTVQGVFTTSSGTPIANATVTAYSGDGDWLNDTQTGATGQYTLRNITAGGVQLQFDNAGLVHWAPGVLDQGSATIYSLAAGGTLTVDEQQPVTGTIAGHFEAAGATVTVFAAAGSPATLNGWTDADGAYSIAAFPGTYHVRFGWQSAQQFAVQAASEAAATPVTVTAGQTTTVDDHKLPVGTVGGRLTEADGSPLADARVTLHHAGDPIGFAVTGEDGTYTLGEALAGDGYTLSYSTEGAAELYVPGTVDESKARPFAVVAGQNTTVDDRRPTPATVHGKLVDTGGSPKADMQVTVQLPNDVQFFTQTAADGTWSVAGVFPADYKVSFTTPDYRRTQWAYGKGTEAEATVIPVAAGADVTVDDTWLPGATLVVDAVDARSGAPVPDYCVWVDSPGDGFGCATTGNRVTIEDLPGGSFTAQATPNEDSYYLQSAGRPVTLTPGRTTRITVRLTLGGKVAYTAAARATGAPVPHACAIFEVLGQGGLPDGYGNCTDATGKATSVHMATGTYEIFGTAPAGYGDQWVGRAGGTGDQTAAARVQVKPGKTVTAPAMLLDPPRPITGVLTDAAGAPLTQMYVAFSAFGDAGPAWNTITDTQGRYTFDNLGPYGWPLLFFGKGYPSQWSGHVGNRFLADRVTGTYNFTPAKGAVLAGTVTAPAGSTWRLHMLNAVTGDLMGEFDSSAAGPGGAYRTGLIGPQQVKIDWTYYLNGIDHHGSYDGTVGIPATGTRTLNITIH